MDARAKLHAVSDSSDTGEGQRARMPSDPLRRLETELSESHREHGDGAQLYQEAVHLLEEAWSVLTECRVMRDGLLEACQEIERAMDDIQRQLGGLSVSARPHEPDQLAGVESAPANGSSLGGAH